MKAILLKIDQLTEPLGLQNRKPRLSWICDAGMKQTAYQVRLSVSGEERYDSGKVETSSMFAQLPDIAKDRERVSVSLVLWDENGIPGEESVTSYEMGISQWKAKWINPELTAVKERQPASVLRREFKVEKTGEARLYITSHGLYEAEINGERAGNFVLAPGTDDYKKRLQYQVYDVTGMLREGDNTIRVTVGDGWYRGNNGIDGENHLFGDDIALLCQLELDGEPVLVSDEFWFASQDGPIRFTDLEIGEAYDARKEEISTWHDVRVEDYDMSVLVCSDEVPITEHETFEGKRIETPDGSVVYDFGQNLAGYTAFELDAREGQKLVIWHGETLDGEGNFTQANIDPGKRNKNGGIPQKIVYTCKEGKNIYKPTFSIFGFRYIKVETEADLSQAKFTSIAVYSDMEKTGSFSCSNEEVNQLFHNSMWSMNSNFVDIPTDCPQRERSGWTGDAGVFVKTGSILRDSYSVFRKWLTECRIAQRKDGLVRNIAPRINDPDKGYSRILDGSTGWGDAIVIVPWTLYVMSGDARILEENYDAMVRWVGFETKLASKKKLKDLFRKDPLGKYVIEKGFHWGEWCEPDVDNGVQLKNNFTKGAPKSATAYFFYSAKLLSQAAEVLGKKSDAEKYAKLAGKIREAYLDRFTNDGLVESERQCDYVRPLEFGLLDREEENAAKLNELVVKKDYHLNTGFLSTPFLCPVLCRYGYTETAYKLLLQDTNPSWLYSVRKGATTIWESWNGIEDGGNASLNHYSYGAVSGWLISGVCGISVEDGQLTLQPCPDPQLGWAKASYASSLGTVESSWRYEDGRVRYEFTVPANTEAKLILPGGETRTLGWGKHEIFA